MATHSDGTFTSAIFNGVPVLEYPLPEDTTHFTVTQAGVILKANYTGPPLDTAHATHTTAYCVGDENISANGPLLSFTRVWSTVPATVDIWETAVVGFPAIGAASVPASYQLSHGGGAIEQFYSDILPRNSAISLDVPVRRHRYYLLPGVAGGYDHINDVKMIPEFRINDVNGTQVGDLETAGAVPAAAEYIRWVINKLEIVAEGTRISKYLGNIWRVETTYAAAR